MSTCNAIAQRRAPSASRIRRGSPLINARPSGRPPSAGPIDANPISPSSRCTSRVGASIHQRSSAWSRASDSTAARTATMKLSSVSAPVTAMEATPQRPRPRWLPTGVEAERRSATPGGHCRRIVSSERDVLLLPVTGADCGRLQLGAVVERRLAVAVVARPEELDAVCDHLDRLAAVPLGVLPFAPFEPPVDRDRPALAEVRRAVLRRRAECCHVEVVRLVEPLPGRIAAAGARREPQRADRRARRCRAKLGITCQVARQGDAIDVAGRHRYLLPWSSW